METTTTNNLKMLHGHTSQDTAFVISDYPWGYSLRTEQRIWLEHKPNKGYRVCRQTKNPKNGRWCNPKKSTYSEFYALVENQENNHVNSIGYSAYSDVEKVQAFKEKWLPQLSPFQIKEIDTFIDLKTKVNDFYKDVEEKTREANKPENRIDNTTLENGVLYPEKTITKLKEEQKAYRVVLRGKGIKKRCRKADTHYIDLGYIIKPEGFTKDQAILLANDFLANNLELVQKSITDFYREWHGVNLCFDNVTFEPPRSEDSMFYGMKSMLFNRENVSININEYLQD